LELLLGVAQPQIDQSMVFFFLKVYRMGEISRDKTVIEIGQDVDNTHSMCLVITDCAFIKIDTA